MKGVNEEQAASLQTALLHGRRGLSCGPGLVFAYVDQQAFDSNELADTALGRAVASIGEPFLSGFNRGTLARDLHEVGCDLLEDPDDARVAERYGPRGLDALEPLGHSRIAHARVTRVPDRGAATGGEVMSEQSPIVNIDSVELTPGGNGTGFANRTARLAAKTLADVVLYPDSGKVAAVSGAFPKTLWHITRLSSTAGGYDG